MRFVLILFLVMFSFAPVYAANVGGDDDNPMTSRDVMMWQRGVAKKDKNYEYSITQLSKKNADFFPNAVISLRNLYAYTSFYEPFSDRLVDEMTQYAYTVQTSSDRMKVNESLIRYKDLVKKHIVNMGVLNFAITMARVSAKFGNADYYEKVRDAIYAGMAATGDGKRPVSAFYIVTRDEEVYVLMKMGVTVERSEVYDVNGKYYNVYDVKLENGDYSQVYMDITRPVEVTYIKKLLAQKEQTYSLPGME